jgi:hypothetical protein
VEKVNVSNQFLNFYPERAIDLGQDMKKQEFKDQSWLGLKTRSRDATLSRHKGININELYLHTKLAQTATGETWRGKWQGNEIAAKILAVRECTPRISRDFNNEYPKLRYRNHLSFYSCERTLNITLGSIIYRRTAAWQGWPMLPFFILEIWVQISALTENILKFDLCPI